MKLTVKMIWERSHAIELGIYSFAETTRDPDTKRIRLTSARNLMAANTHGYPYPSPTGGLTEALRVWLASAARFPAVKRAVQWTTG